MKQKIKSAGKLASLFLTAMLFVFSVSVPASAAMPERPENQYVLDSAGVLSEETEKEIIQKNEKLFAKTGAQIVIAAVDFLGGQEIDDYTYDMFNSWGVGSSQRNNGILLVLAVGEDNYYAQAGYGIDTYFDGAKLKELLNDKLEADFAAGDYEAGVKKFFTAMYSELESYYANYSDEYTQQNGQNQGQTEPGFTAEPHSGVGSGIAKTLGTIFGVVVIVIVIAVFLAILRGIGGGRGGPRGGGGGGGGFLTGMLLGNMMGGRRNRWRGPPPGGFGGRRPPRGGGGFGGFGGFTGGGNSGGGGFGRGGGFGGGGFGGGGGFSGGGGSHGGGAGRG